MTIVSQSVLVESASARSQALANVSNERALEVLNKAKALIMAMWQGSGIATIKQVAEYYETGDDAIESLIRRNQHELVNNGAKKVKRKELGELSAKLTESSNAPQFWVLTPRAMICIGMILTESEVAASLRSVLLDIVEQAPQQQQAFASQESRIRELELQLELAKTQDRLTDNQLKLLATVQLLETVSPGLAPLALGKADAVVERVEYVERTVTPNATYEGVGITYIQKRFGFSSTAQAWNWLESIGYGKFSGKWELQLSAVETPKMPLKVLQEIGKNFSGKQGDRQMLLGE